MTTAREVVEACARALSAEEYPNWQWDRVDEIVKRQFARDVLAVIRALAAAGCTEQMRRVSINRHYEHIDVTMSKVLTALADGYEREGGG